LTLNKFSSFGGVVLMPNPLAKGNKLSIQMLAQNGEEYEVKVIDLTGKELDSQIIHTNVGLNQIELISENKLPKGIYTVHFVGLNSISGEHHPIKLAVE
jgi:hypothetical protein